MGADFHTQTCINYSTGVGDYGCPATALPTGWPDFNGLMASLCLEELSVLHTGKFQVWELTPLRLPPELPSINA